MSVSSGMKRDGETSDNVGDCIAEGIMVTEGLR